MSHLPLLFQKVANDAGQYLSLMPRVSCQGKLLAAKLDTELSGAWWAMSSYELGETPGKWQGLEVQSFQMVSGYDAK